MKQPTIRGLLSLVGGLSALMSSCPASSQVQEQAFTLQPGWNAIYLEVEPQPNDTASLFQSLPDLASVWTWDPQASSVEEIPHPDELAPGEDGWLAYFPESQPDAASTNLFAMRAGRPYLIEIGGTESIPWTVVGRPSVRGIDWRPNSFNLVGFPIDPAAPPTFAAFFAPSPAHAGQEIRRLSRNGQWDLVTDPASTAMRQGEAFWIFSTEGSQYAGPLNLELEQGDGLVYGQILLERSIRMTNLTAGPTSVSIRSLPADSPVQLSYWDGDRGPTEAGWTPLEAALEIQAAAGEEVLLRLAVSRPADDPNAEYRSTLEITSDTGARLLVPVAAEGRDQAGLWVGRAVIDAVSEPTSAEDPEKPTPTASEFQFRLLLHVDGDGQAKLLKEVTQMWKEGTYKPDPDDPSTQIVDQPSHFVLLTDESLIDQFTGAGLRDGQPVGRRLSSAAFDFEEQSLELAGDLGGELKATITLPADGPTNPFKHAFHPDHDNLDEPGQPAEEAYSVTREITLDFTAEDPTGLPSVSWTDAEIGGQYTEVIAGLHKQDIVVRGHFRLRRASLRHVLNQ